MARTLKNEDPIRDVAEAGSAAEAKGIIEGQINGAKASAPIALPDDALAPEDKGKEMPHQFVPYKGRDGLPPSSTKIVDKVVDGKTVKQLVQVRPGEWQYFVVQHPGGVCDLMRVRSKYNGTQRQLYKVLMPNNTKDKKRASRDRAFLGQLRRLGIPGA